jgi:hypothetical protein
MAGDPDEPSIPPGGWLDFKSNLLLLVEMFMFAARFAEEVDAVEDFVLHLQATDLVERKLATTDSRIFLSDPEECRASLLEFRKVVPVGEFRAEWEAICAMVMKRFVDLFPGPSVDLQIMQSWIEKFKSRSF